MDKTSREYAEKLAAIKFPSNTPSPSLRILMTRANFVDNYLTAIEETNAKGLLEALEKARAELYAVNYSTIRKLHGMEESTKLAGESVSKYTEAIRKAKEVTNG